MEANHPATQNQQTDELNEAKLKKILVNFERKVNENQRLRIKHCESPTKFAGSETELYASLDELQSLATRQDLYHVLLAKKSLQLLLSLLAHDNGDISAKVISILQELTDVDDESDQINSYETLIEALKAENIVSLIVGNLDRFDCQVKDEAQAINTSLAIIDNLIDFEGEFAVVESERIIKWMLKQLGKSVEFNGIKLATAELLSVLLMSSHENKIHLHDGGGVDVLLQQVAYYRRVCPVTGDEHEFLEQIINCLCTAILDCEQNREAFYKEEGVDLVELILREKREAIRKSNIKMSTLKLFNHVVSTEKNEDRVVSQCCERFVQILGLKVLFPIFMQPKVIVSKKVKKREYYQVLDEIEEHCLAIVLALLKYCQDGEKIQRVLIKFAECNFEKLDRLLELHEKYFRLVSSQEELSGDEAGGEALARAGSSAKFSLRTADYIVLLTSYLSSHFETYEPASGETFGAHLGRALAAKPALRHQLVLGARQHLEEVGGESAAESNSLELLLAHFQATAAGANKGAPG